MKDMNTKRAAPRQDLLSFDVLNAIMLERLGNATFYVGRRWSFLKIFQHALSNASNRQDIKLLQVNWSLPVLVMTAREVLRSFRGKRLSRPALKPVVLIDPGRSVIINGRVEPVYLGRIIEVIGRERVSVITSRKEGIPYSDHERSALAGSPGIPDRNEREMIAELCSAYRRARKEGHFSAYELEHLSSSMEVFLCEFRYWYGIFKGQDIRRCIFTSHYHNEGLVAACNLLGITCEELQHGLIARNDLYNVYPQAYVRGIENAFFPDVLYVYGEYWKRLLLSGCEHPDEKIVVAGNYLLGSDPDEGKPGAKQNIILVCSQKKMASTYEQIVSVLRQVLHAHRDWSLLIRLHPLEDQPARYHAMTGDRIRICPKEMSLADCLRVSKIQVSVYSTTFFDALGFDVVNFAVNATGFERYVSEMVEDGVAFPMSLTDDPVARYEAIIREDARLPERLDVYAPFRPEVFA